MYLTPSILLSNSVMLLATTTVIPTNTQQWLQQALQTEDIIEAQTQAAHLVSAFVQLNYASWTAQSMQVLRQLEDLQEPKWARLEGAQEFYRKVLNAPILLDCLDHLPETRKRLGLHGAYLTLASPSAPPRDQFILAKWFRSREAVPTLDKRRALIQLEARELRSEIIRSVINEAYNTWDGTVYELACVFCERLPQISLDDLHDDYELFQVSGHLPYEYQAAVGALLRHASLLHEVATDDVWYEKLAPTAPKPSELSQVIAELPARRPEIEAVERAIRSTAASLGPSSDFFPGEMYELVRQQWIIPFGTYGWSVAGYLLERLPSYVRSYGHTHQAGPATRSRPSSDTLHHYLIEMVAALRGLLKPADVSGPDQTISRAIIDQIAADIREPTFAELDQVYRRFRSSLWETLVGDGRRLYLNSEFLQRRLRTSLFQIAAQPGPDRSLARHVLRWPLYVSPPFIEQILALMGESEDVAIYQGRYYLTELEIQPQARPLTEAEQTRGRMALSQVYRALKQDH